MPSSAATSTMTRQSSSGFSSYSDNCGRFNSPKSVILSLSPLSLFSPSFILGLFVIVTAAACFETSATYSLTGFAHAAPSADTNTTCPSSSPITFTFGYLRMTAGGVDSASTLAAYLSTVRAYNDQNKVPGVRFELNVTTVPCLTLNACRRLTAEHEAIVASFINSMHRFAAVMKPNFIIAQRVVDAGKRIGCPIVNPDDMRSSAFTAESENVIHFHQSWRRQSEHMFTYMHQTSRCAHSAIAHDNSAVVGDHDYSSRIASIQQLFLDGGYPLPAVMDVAAASDAEFERFFMEDYPRRRCFIILGTNGLMMETMERLVKAHWYSAESYRFYGFSTMASDKLTVNGSAAHFAKTSFVHWMPSFFSETFDNAFNHWVANPIAAEAAMLGPDESFVQTYGPMGLQAYMVMATVLEVSRAAVANSVLLADPTAERVYGRPVSHEAFLTEFYAGSREVDGHWFNHLVRKCPRPPASQTACFCNILTANSYIYNVNTTTGVPFLVTDNPLVGERNVHTVAFPGSCGYQISSWAYPITGLALYPGKFMGSNGYREADMLETYNLFETVFGEMTRVTNYAPTPPTRALSYSAYRLEGQQDHQAALQHYLDTLNPFVVYGTMGDRITDSGKVLTLTADLMTISLEDPVLVPHAQWKWNILHLRPTQADYIHALAAYYAEYGVGLYTSLHVVASTRREAELISMSFATWGYDVPVESILVTDDAYEWVRTVSSWLTSSTSFHPFVLASSHANNNSEIITVAKAAAAIGRGTLAVACGLGVVDIARDVVDFSPINLGSDIIFGSFVREWWLPSAYAGVPESLHKYVPRAAYSIAMLSIDVASQLAAQVYFDYKTTAAEVLYKMSVISARDQSFGPFSNETCTPAQIAANTRNRNCQCTKGLRTVYVLSLRSLLEAAVSDRTHRFAWTMTACGIIYSPYVNPNPTSNALSASAVAGIAVAAVVFVLGSLGATIFTILTSGRNNARAPKERSKPFTIVFTDIQSSTALWARAPSAMSEAVELHHKVLRKAIRRNDGYEVKTVGDSFMVAFKEVEDAVRFALDVQLSLHHEQWNSELDATYIELEMEAETFARNGGGGGAFGGGGGDDSSSVPTNATDAAHNDGTRKDSAAHTAMHSQYLGSMYNNHQQQHQQLNVETISHISTNSVSNRNFGASHVVNPSLAPHAGDSHYYHHHGGGGGCDPLQSRGLPSTASQHLSYHQQHRSGAGAGVLSSLPQVPEKMDSNQQQEGNGSSSKQSSIPAAPFVAGTNADKSVWHGLRVRIGVHHGHGDIRKDPVTQGYDYYGTVTNTAARVEGVGHGGQILLTDGVLESLPTDTIKHAKAVLISLGPQPLRGLDEPIKLYQLVPEKLQARRFPALRLHIEKETEDDSTMTADTGTSTNNSTVVSESPEALIARLCSTKQYAALVPADDLLDRFHFFLQTFAPSSAKHRMAVVAKLGEAWGFEKANSAVYGTEGNRTRLTVSLLAKITKAYNMSSRHNGNNGRFAAGGHHNRNNTTTTTSHTNNNNNTDGTESSHHASHNNDGASSSLGGGAVGITQQPQQLTAGGSFAVNGVPSPHLMRVGGGSLQRRRSSSTSAAALSFHGNTNAPTGPVIAGAAKGTTVAVTGSGIHKDSPLTMSNTKHNLHNNHHNSTNNNNNGSRAQLSGSGFVFSATTSPTAAAAAQQHYTVSGGGPCAFPVPIGAGAAAAIALQLNNTNTTNAGDDMQPLPATVTILTELQSMGGSVMSSHHARSPSTSVGFN